MSVIRAPRLRKGDTIGVFSPSCPSTAWIPERTRLAFRFMEDKGYRLKPGSLTGKIQTYRSGSIQERADELNRLIRDPDVHCIMASAGGFVSNSLLPYIDYTALKVHPKIIIGFSDVTAILLSIYAKIGLTTFYGPNLISTFGEIAPFSEESFRYFEQVVDGSLNFPYVFPTPDFWTDDSVGLEETGFECTKHANKLITVRGGSVTGRILGGNLNTLPGFFGTQYMPEIREGDILMLEDARELPESIERSFSLLENAGIFERIGGLILGKHADYNDGKTGLKSWEVPLEIVGKYRFPILAEFDCCHTRPMLTMPIGATIHLNADAQTVSIPESPVL